MSFSVEESRAFLEKNLYFDIHGHIEKTLPGILRVLNPGKIPRDIKLRELKRTGVNGFIICALGDPNSFRMIKTDPFISVMNQLKHIKRKITQAGGIVAVTVKELTDAAASGALSFVLGIEGGDFIGDEPERLTAVYNEGVRLLSPMHYSKNQIGSISFGWGGRIVPEEEQTGLTKFGETIIREAERLGILLDLAHADERTIRDITSAVSLPVVCSHTGPRRLHDFPRYISDEAMKAIAETGGLAGIWPFFSRGLGMKDSDDFIRYTSYTGDLIGAEHLSIGTDINGVPGNMEGYENLFDAPRLISALSACGFSEKEIKRVSGDNFIELFKRTMKSEL